MARRNRGFGVRPVYSFALTWIILSAFLPLYRVWGLLLALGISAFVAYQIGRASGRSEGETAAKQEKTQAPPLTKTEAKPKAQARPAAQKKSYGPEIDPILEEGNKALAEMGRLYQSSKDPAIRTRINELMRVTDKITQDAIADPSDIPQIKKFMNYYLPTTLKLLNAHDRMSAQGIQGENLDKTMKSIEDMLDDAIEAYKKMLDSLFANQALDIETEIEVMNTMLAREGLSGEKDFQVQSQGGR